MITKGERKEGSPSLRKTGAGGILDKEKENWDKDYPTGRSCSRGKGGSTVPSSGVRGRARIRSNQRGFEKRGGYASFWREVEELGRRWLS